MDIIEKARELGEMIQESEQMAKMKDMEAKQAADETAQTLLQEFNLERMNLARDMQSGKLSQEDAVKKNNAAFDAILEKSPVLKQYVEAKGEFDNLVNQINGVLNFYITGQDQDQSCTHDCGTCGGCH